MYGVRVHMHVCMCCCCYCCCFPRKHLRNVPERMRLYLSWEINSETWLSLGVPLSHEAACHPEWMSALHGSLKTYLCWQGGFILSFRLWLPDNTLGGSQPHTDAGITTCWSVWACQSGDYLISDGVSFHPDWKGWVFDLILQVNCKIFEWAPGWQSDSVRQVLLSWITGKERGSRTEGTIKNKSQHSWEHFCLEKGTVVPQYNDSKPWIAVT